MTETEITIRKCLDMAEEEGYITKSSSLSELNDCRYEILSFRLTDDEIADLNENEVERIFNDWLY